MNNNNIPNMVPPIPNQNEQNNNFNQVPNQNFNNVTGMNNQQVEPNNMNYQQQNAYINPNINQNNTMINDLNVEGSYNQLENIPYANEERVIQNINGNKKKTVTISKELRTVIILALILLLVILFMPNISEFINDFRFN